VVQSKLPEQGGKVPGPPEPAVASGHGAKLRALIIEVARSYLGVREDPRANNTGAAVEDILRRAGGKRGMAWCCAFCDVVVEEAHRRLGLKPPLNVGLSCSSLVKRARELHRVFDDPSEAREGDLIVLRGGKTLFRHVGIVAEAPAAIATSPGGGAGTGAAAHTAAAGPTWVKTIEGNTNAAGSAEGDGVYLRRRRCALRPDHTRPCVFVRVV